jgi:hypothetical protein
MSLHNPGVKVINATEGAIGSPTDTNIRIFSIMANPGATVNAKITLFDVANGVATTTVSTLFTSTTGATLLFDSAQGILLKNGGYLKTGTAMGLMTFTYYSEL